MNKKWIMTVVALVCGGLLTGCSTYTRENTTVRHYLQDKKRVDLGMHGNAGYLQGRPDDVEGPTKDTRKIYVVEVTTDDNNLDDMPFGSEGVVKKTVVMDEGVTQTTDVRVVDSRPRVNIPTFEDENQAWGMEDDEMNEITEFVEYTVEKTDTLQKISKKFYNSYSKWPKIYDVNRDVIKDPNFLKPGTVIKIPDIR